MKLTEESITAIFNKQHKQLIESYLAKNNDARKLLDDEYFVKSLYRLNETKEMLIELIFEMGLDWLEKADVPDPVEFFIKLSQDVHLMNSWNNPDIKWDDIYYDVATDFKDCFGKSLI